MTKRTNRFKLSASRMDIFQSVLVYPQPRSTVTFTLCKEMLRLYSVAKAPHDPLTWSPTSRDALLLYLLPLLIRQHRPLATIKSRCCAMPRSLMSAGAVTDSGRLTSGPGVAGRSVSACTWDMMIFEKACLCMCASSMCVRVQCLPFRQIKPTKLGFFSSHVCSVLFSQHCVFVCERGGGCLAWALSCKKWLALRGAVEE